jgi:hypothetical protein
VFHPARHGIHPTIPVSQTYVSVTPLSCSVRQQGACSRRRHPKRDAGASSRPLAANHLTTLSFVLHGLPPPALAPLWFGRPGRAVKWRARPDRVTTHQGVRAAALAVFVSPGVDRADESGVYALLHAAHQAVWVSFEEVDRSRSAYRQGYACLITDFTFSNACTVDRSAFSLFSQLLSPGP